MTAPAPATGGHRVTLEESAADAIDTAAAAAFCEDCDWRGEWRHSDDPDDDVVELATADGAEHTLETTPVLPIGTRVRLRRDVYRYPHAIGEAGELGTVDDSSRGYLSVRLDVHHPGLEEWDNALVWQTEDGDPLEDVEAVPA